MRGKLFTDTPASGSSVSWSNILTIIIFYGLLPQVEVVVVVVAVVADVVVV
jgi:hypothetical protein